MGAGLGKAGLHGANFRGYDAAKARAREMNSITITITTTTTITMFLKEITYCSG